MSVVHILKWAEPKPGHEFAYDLAWKHRLIASAWMLEGSRIWWKPCVYRRAYRLWASAMDRIKVHGQDVEYCP